jgi:hypothetical protein
MNTEIEVVTNENQGALFHPANRDSSTTGAEFGLLIWISVYAKKESGASAWMIPFLSLEIVINFFKI